MSDERAIQPDQSRSLSLPGQPSRLLTRGLRHLDQPRRRLIELDTSGESAATDLNDHGQVVGWAAPAAGTSYAWTWIGEHLSELSTPDGHFGSANAINNSGQVIGAYWDAPGGSRPCLWDAGSMVDLGVAESIDLSITVRGPNGVVTYDGGPQRTDVHTHANDINDAGQIVGEVSVRYLSEDNNRRSRELARIHIGFLWEAGQVTPLKVIPKAINNAGQMIGYSFFGGKTFQKQEYTLPGLDEARSRALMAGSCIAGAVAINDHGQVVGAIHEGDPHAFLLDANGQHPLGYLDKAHAFSIATGINNRGQVVGWSGSVDDSVVDPAITEPWTRWANARRVAYPFLWERGRMVALDEMLGEHDSFPRPLALVTSGVAFYSTLDLSINEAGQIAGTLQTRNGDRHAFLCI
ncbi:MAG: hypothetical protein M3464_01150 [Chloroflexota bacterium]|nr:hypothetical protein [Chloroflexota bacterium]